MAYKNCYVGFENCGSKDDEKSEVEEVNYEHIA